MRIAFCTPFKPLDHPRASGDVTIARDLYQYLADNDIDVQPAPHFQTTWFWRRLWQRIRLVRARREVRRFIRSFRPDVWFTYHSYYKAPDLFGPMARSMGLPYAIFAGAHSPKRAKERKTRPGHDLNLKALAAADHVFVNKERDLPALDQAVPPAKRSFVRPGILTRRFFHDRQARQELRQKWGVNDRPVVVSAALFRPGVKTKGLEWVIRTCAGLIRQGLDLTLAIAGDGPERPHLEAMAAREFHGMEDKIRFLGLWNRFDLYRVYSAGDMFLFPGINEGLGMVYLEAQCAGLPVVAFDHDGAPEVVAHGKTGLITPSFDEQAFSEATARILTDADLRRTMSAAAQRHARERHDLHTNYAAMLETLYSLARRRTNG